MAKYDVRFACGHTATVELFGKSKDREKKIAWYEKEGVCPDCYKRDLQAARDAEHAAAHEENNLLGLPELTGSDKQKSWAFDLRGAALREITNALDDSAITFPADVDRGAAVAAIKKRVAELHTDSRFWIDRRNQITDPMQLIREAIRSFGSAENFIDSLNKSGKSSVV